MGTAADLPEYVEGILWMIHNPASGALISQLQVEWRDAE